MKTINAYPLAWPVARPRTRPERRTWSNFKTLFGRARDNCLGQIRTLGGTEIIISTNLALRQDGLPMGGQAQPRDPGVAVYFNYRKKQMCFACDRWAKVDDNMHAIALTIEALRGISRWGTGDMMEAAFTGFAALPAPVAGGKPWRQVLDVGDFPKVETSRTPTGRSALKRTRTTAARTRRSTRCRKPTSRPRASWASNREAHARADP
jgi:hypothetical protein